MKQNICRNNGRTVSWLKLRHLLKILIVLVTFEINVELELITYIQQWAGYKELSSYCALWNLSRGSLRVGSAPSLRSRRRPPGTDTRTHTHTPQTRHAHSGILFVTRSLLTFGYFRPPSARFGQRSHVRPPNNNNYSTAQMYLLLAHSYARIVINIAWQCNIADEGAGRWP